VKLRLSVFLFTAVILSLAEFFFSYRKRRLPRLARWPANIAIVMIDSLVARWILPIGITGVALWAKSNNFGLFNYFHFPQLVSVIFTFIIFDFAIYLQHLYSHKWNFLWIFHRVHHSDPDLDVTSALRFHPVEILDSMA
jgi:sterol desaturase/sphingolipid hydroxylase (fatty acid hydroxylase superfamily)